MDDNMFEDISENPEEADEAVEETLKAYREALQQEWQEKNDPTNLRQTAKNAKEEIARYVPDYLANMRALAMGATAENTRYQANKWLLENALLPNGAGAKDTLAELLEEMEAEAKNAKENADGPT